MTYDAKSPEDYIDQLPEDRKIVVSTIYNIFKENMPEGFEFCLNYKMPAAVIPHSLYEGGYHCDPKLPLPFASVASQKNFVALYHSGIYAIPEIHDWWVKEYPNHAKRKLDMGKSCIRFKKMDDIPYELITELMKKLTPQDFIDVYSKQDPRNK